MSLRPPRATVGVRSFVDYALVRQATLHDLRSGYVTTTDVCDPHPDLIRAALNHGEPTTRSCPVCRGGDRGPDRLDPRLGINGGPGLPGAGGLVFLRYVYGEELGQYSGRIRSQHDVTEISLSAGSVKVYVVEVCIACGWNHLVASYVVGDGTPRAAPRRQRTVEDEWGT
jgi:uncharacterized protein DUF5318